MVGKMAWNRLGETLRDTGRHGVLVSMDAGAKTILVVDDDPTTVRWVEVLVRRLGFDAAVAFDGGEAVRHLAEQPFVAVISDIEMPVMNGFDLLQFVQLRLPELPVILMSATCTAERREAARMRGALALLEKPVTTNQLTALIGSGAPTTARDPVKACSCAR